MTDLRENPIIDTDSYKTSHYLQYPPGMKAMFSYLESRGGEFERTVFFGLQYLIKQYLQKPVTTADIDEAETFCRLHGVPFPRKGWERVRDLGYFPIRIKAVREGSVIPVNNVLMTVESTDPDTFWIVGWLETMLMRLWYPITVATLSWHCKRVIFSYLMKSSDDPFAEIDFKLHDFGSRGASSRETAAIGGMSHLSNFKGSDTMVGIYFANHFYGTPEGMAGFSIPAAEHSTITTWGREMEIEAYRNMIKQFAKPGTLVACVSDSYDLYNVVENIWGRLLRAEVEQSGAKLVIRPDSGSPPEVVRRCQEILDKQIGLTKNKKGYKVLPPYYGIIQGDGINIDSIGEILDVSEKAGFSASNIAFGMGGALLQKVNRDTQSFAFKCCAADIDGKWHEVYKDPVTDPGKRSKRGRLDLVRGSHGPETVPEGSTDAESLLHVVFEDGKQVGNSIMLDVVRANTMEAARGFTL
jgi:nicotinamide phosphoribosyltransferase